MLYKWSDRMRSEDLITLTQQAAEDGGGLRSDLWSVLVLTNRFLLDTRVVWTGISRS